MWLKQSTGFTAIVGPILDSAGAEYTGAVIGDLSISKNGTEAAMASAATLTHVSNGYYTLAGTTGNSDTLGRVTIRCNKSTYQMPSHHYVVLPETVFDALVTNATTAAGGLGDIQRIAGTAQTANDIGADVDAILVDTGTDIPAQISGIGTAGGAAINVDATTDNAAGGISGVTSGTVKVGTQTGTFSNTSFVDASYHVITHAANTFDWVYQFLTGGGTNVVSATWTGYLTSGDDTVTFSAWNHVGGAWETIGTQAGQPGSANVTKTLTLYARHRGTSAAELGKVYIRVQDTGTSPVLRTDALSVSYAVTSRSVGYANGEVWIDTVNGTAGTESFVNGVADFPVLTLADALTIATANKLTNFNIANGSTITLAGATTTKRFEGHEWILALGGQNISGTNFEGANAVTGTSSGTTDVQFEDCVIGNGSVGATLPPGTYIRCGFNTDSGLVFTGSAAGRYVFVDCYSNIAVGGTSTPHFVFTGASPVMFRRYSGGANITFDANTAALTYECVGGGGLTVALAGADIEMRGIIRDVTLTGITSASTVRFVGTTGAITLGGADGTANIYGVVGLVTDNRTGGTLTNTANLNTDLDAILADTNELQTDWVNGGRLDLILDATATQTSVNTIYDLLDTEVATIVTAVGTTIPSTLTTLLSKLLKYFQLALRKDSAIATDNATEVTAINANGGSGVGGYLNTTDSQQALRDNYTTGGDTILVAPIVATIRGNNIVSSGITQAFRYTPLPSGPITVVDANDDPIDLSGAAVKIMCFHESDTTDDWMMTEATELTVGGASNNEVSVDYVPVDFVGRYKWWLYYQPSGETNWILAGFGFWDIADGPDPRDP